MGLDAGSWQFSSAYCVNPAFFYKIPDSGIFSVVTYFIELIREGKLLGVEVNEGDWLDLSTPESYLEAHRIFGEGNHIDPSAVIDSSAVLENTCVGAGSEIGPNCVLQNCIIWPGVNVPEGTEMKNHIFH